MTTMRKMPRRKNTRPSTLFSLKISTPTLLQTTKMSLVTSKWVFNLDLCDGELHPEDFRDCPWGLTGHRVLELINHLRGVWRTIYTDNFYTSPALALELLRRMQYLIGTLRKNRLPADKPDDFLATTKHPKPSLRCPKGTIAAIVNETKTVAVYSLMDSSMVYIIDTRDGPVKMADMLRRQKAGDVVILLVYEGIVMYNKKMGGVDAVDQMRTGYYSVEMTSKSKKWTVCFVEAIFNFMLTQAWVAFRFLNPTVAKEGRNAFMQEICANFLDNDFDDKRCNVTRAAVAEQQTTKQNMEWGYHHANVRMEAKQAEGDRI
jgi:hypothetical protein